MKLKLNHIDIVHSDGRRPSRGIFRFYATVQDNIIYKYAGSDMFFHINSKRAFKLIFEVLD